MENFEARAFLENLAELDATSRLYTCPLTGFRILRAILCSSNIRLAFEALDLLISSWRTSERCPFEM